MRSNGHVFLSVQLFLLVIASTIFFTMYIINLSSANAIESHIPTMESRVLDYIKTHNRQIDHEVAETLASSIVTESERYKIPVNVMLGVIKAESNFDQYAISNVGAIGFWQVLPKWHIDKIRKLENRDLYDPVTNSSLGAKILHDCLKKSRTLERGLLCYNGSQHDPEKKYVKRVMDFIPTRI